MFFVEPGAAGQNSCNSRSQRFYPALAEEIILGIVGVAQSGNVECFLEFTVLFGRF